MKHLPGYLNIGPETYYAPRSNRDNEDYQPLLAVWLIDLSLSLGRRTQVQPSPRELRLTQPLLRKVIRAILKKGRADWLERGVNPALPLFRNIERLEQLVMLNDVEKGIIAFAAAMAEFPAFCEALSPSRISFSDIGLFRALAIVTGHDADAIQTALRRDGTLRCSGLIEIDHDEEPLPRKISLVRELRGVNEMLTQMESYRSIFIASTNLMDNLDAASLRRFDLKIRFAYLKPDQSVELLHDYTRWLHLDEPESADEHAVRKLKNLTPGDFAAVCRQHQLRRIDTAKDLVQALEKESELKQDGRQAPTIGFLA